MKTLHLSSSKICLCAILLIWQQEITHSGQVQLACSTGLVSIKDKKNLSWNIRYAQLKDMVVCRSSYTSRKGLILIVARLVGCVGVSRFHHYVFGLVWWQNFTSNYGFCLGNIFKEANFDFRQIFPFPKFKFQSFFGTICWPPSWKGELFAKERLAGVFILFDSAIMDRCDFWIYLERWKKIFGVSWIKIKGWDSAPLGQNSGSDEWLTGEMTFLFAACMHVCLCVSVSVCQCICLAVCVSACLWCFCFQSCHY